MKSFKNPSSYHLHKGKQFKKKLFYSVILANGIIFYASRYNTDLYFHFSPTQENIDIIKGCDQLRKGIYRSTFYLFSPLLMSLYGAKFDPVPYLKYEREFIDLPDGGHMSLDWSPIHNKYEETEDMRILVIVHGLTGGSSCNYIKHAALNGYRFGFRTVCINFRGIDSPMKNGNITDYSKTEDIHNVLQQIQKNYPKANIYGMGISMGANQLVKYAGEQGDKCALKGIVSISNPWDVYNSTLTLQRKDKFLYNRAITQNFVRNYKRNQEQMQENVEKYNLNEEKILKCKTLEQFDQEFTQKVLQYENNQEYYKNVSCKNVIPNIKIPVMAIQALDDPICSPDSIPKQEIMENDNIILVTTQKGGHIDYFTGYKAIRWVYWPCMEYLNYIDKFIINNNEVA